MAGIIVSIGRSIGLPPETTEDVRRKYEPIIETYGRNLGVRLAGAIVSRAKADGWKGNGPYPPSALQDLSLRLAGLLEGRSTDPVARFAAILAVEQEYLHLADRAEQAAIALGVRERFDRVGSNHARMAQAVRSQRPITAPLDADGLADTVIMLNQIHSKYLLDIAREVEEAGQKSQLLYRLRRVMLIVGCGISIYLLVQVVIALMKATGLADLGLFLLGMLLIFGLGYLGSIISVSQRMQAATAENVLEGDPVSAIGRLAAGWDSVKLSMSTAGIFAVIAYVLIAANAAAVLGLSGGLFPRTDQSQLCRAGVQFDMRGGAVAADEERETRGPDSDEADGAAGQTALPGGGGAGAGGNLPAETVDPATAAQAAADPQGTSAAATPDSPDRGSGARLATDSEEPETRGGEAVVRFGDRFARALYLCDRTDLLRMIVIAVIAGFAERLIPDVLTKVAGMGSSSIPRRPGSPLPPPDRQPEGRGSRPDPDGEAPVGPDPETPADAAKDGGGG